MTEGAAFRPSDVGKIFTKAIEYLSQNFIAVKVSHASSFQIGTVEEEVTSPGAHPVFFRRNGIGELQVNMADR